MAEIKDASEIPEVIDPKTDKVHTWPHLVRAEFICGLLIFMGLFVWSLLLDAPLEEPADPTKTPNPSKAPWYFLGLQEILVYFDPWMAGVVLPSLIIVGLMVIPYIDINPKGNGYYTWKERKFAVASFCFGFLILWVSLIIVGVFLRGPGWNFFAPWAEWDPHKVVALTNVDLNILVANLTGLDILRNSVAAAIFGTILVGAYYSLIPIYWMVKVKTSKTLQELGIVRYGITAFLFLTMMSLPIKMLLRWTLNIKYIVKFPWINLNI
ncbi:MAG: cytochrome C [Deltaproteobacteria bacterium]|nr:cytochrome C [Deltaproteobacteria bacterium]